MSRRNREYANPDARTTVHPEDADRWLCRRSPDCRHTPCPAAFVAARRRRVRAAYRQRA